MDKSTIEWIYTECSTDGLERLDAESRAKALYDIIGSTKDTLQHTGEAGDEALKAVIGILEQEDKPAEAILAEVRAYLQADHERIQAEYRRYEAHEKELYALIGSYFAERGYAVREKGTYEKRGARCIGGIRVNICAGCSTDELIMRTMLSALRAMVKNGKVRTRGIYYEQKGQRIIAADHPADSFDIFGEYGIIPSSIFWDSALKEKMLWAEDLAFNEEKQGVYRDPNEPDAAECAYVSSAEQAFEKLRPYLDCALALAEGQKPDKRFLKQKKLKLNGGGGTAFFFAFGMLLACGLFLGLLLAAVFFIFDLIAGGERIPFIFFVRIVYRSAALFMLLSFTFIIVKALIEKRRARL